MTSKDYLKQIAESKGVCLLTNEVKDNALLFPVGFEKIFQGLDKLENLEKTLNIIIDREVNIQAFRKHNYKTYEDYKRLTNLHENSTPLTEEEFYSVQEELLKEVLEDVGQF